MSLNDAGSSNKVFVGGLPQSCSDEAFTDYFKQFGSIVDIVVMKDKDTGNSRGFGFVTYDDVEAVDAVIAKAKDHQIRDKWVDVKRATPKGDSPPPQSKGSSKGGGGGGGGGGMRGGDDRGGGAPRGDTRPGDWTCPGCRANVFASKDSCFKCGSAKPSGGGGGGGGGGGSQGKGYGDAYGQPYGAYGAPPPQYGAYPQYGAPPQYAAYPGAYGGYGQPPPQYGGYPGYPPQAYGGPPQGYGGPPQGYGGPPPQGGGGAPDGAGKGYSPY